MQSRDGVKTASGDFREHAEFATSDEFELAAKTNALVGVSQRLAEFRNGQVSKPLGQTLPNVLTNC
jgi:hypothetical protein